MTNAIVALVEHYLPVLVTAGEYACRIQSRVAAVDQKLGANDWARALTDADLMVQHFVEIATLAHDRDIGFYGEESARSANTKYFSTTAETVVHLDPINGTYLYQNRRDGWDIVLSIRQAGRLVAALSYMPARGRFYIAIEGIGAVTGERECRGIERMEALTTKPGSRLCLTYRAPGIREKLTPEFACFDIVEDDDPARGVDNLNDLFTGRLDAFACPEGALLDWGAAAYIVSAAGGCASRLDGTAFTAFGDYDPEKNTDMLVAADPATHRRLLELLNRPAGD